MPRSSRPWATPSTTSRNTRPLPDGPVRACRASAPAGSRHAFFRFRPGQRLAAAAHADTERLMNRRVVITGTGLVTPVGLDVPGSWAALLAGRSGAAPITQFDTTGF